MMGVRCCFCALSAPRVRRSQLIEAFEVVIMEALGERFLGEHSGRSRLG